MDAPVALLLSKKSSLSMDQAIHYLQVLLLWVQIAYLAKGYGHQLLRNASLTQKGIPRSNSPCYAWAKFGRRRGLPREQRTSWHGGLSGPAKHFTDLACLIKLIFAGEKRLSSQQLSSNTASGPDIHLGAIVCCSKQKLKGPATCHRQVQSWSFCESERHGIVLMSHCCNSSLMDLAARMQKEECVLANSTRSNCYKLPNQLYA